MKSQKIKQGFIALLLAILLCSVVCVLVTTKPQIAFADDAPVVFEQYKYDNYTDTDTFVYKGNTYNIRQFNDSEVLKRGNAKYVEYSNPSHYRFEIDGDNAIVQIVPKELFNLVGDHLYIGKEYGFFIHTEELKPYPNKVSTVLIFDIIMENLDLNNDSGIVKVTVEPIIQREFVYLSKSQNRYFFRDTTHGSLSGFEEHYEITEDYVIPHFFCAVVSPNDDFVGVDYPMDTYYLKDISYAVNLMNEQSSNAGMPDYDRTKDTGSYITYFDYTYEGITWKNGELSTETKYDFGAEMVSMGLSVGKAVLKNIPVLGQIVSVTDMLMSVVGTTKTIAHYGYERENFLKKSEVSINNGKISGTHYYANRDDQIEHYGNIAKSAITIIKTTKDGDSIWYKNGNKATGYFKIGHSALGLATPDHTRLIRQIGLTVVSKDGTEVDTQTSHYNYMLRQPVAETLDINKKGTVRLLDNGENYFSFAPQYSSKYKLSVGTGQDIQVFVNGNLINGTKSGTSQTYILPLVGGSNNTIKLKVVNEGCFADIAIDVSDSVSNLSVDANKDYIVKITNGSIAQLKTVGLEVNNAVIKSVYEYTAGKLVELNTNIGFTQPEKQLDIMMKANGVYYVVLRSNVNQTLNVIQTNVAKLAVNGNIELSLLADGSYKFFEVNTSSQSSYILTLLDSNTKFAPTCGIAIKAYDSNGNNYTNLYYLSNSYKLQTIGTKYYVGFKALANVNLTIDMKKDVDAFKWEVFKEENGRETLVQAKSIKNTFVAELDYSKDIKYRFVFWINDRVTAKGYDWC